MNAIAIGLFYGLKNIAAQVFFWRIFYLAFSSNELSFGTILGVWLLTSLPGLLVGQIIRRKDWITKLLPAVLLLDLAGFCSASFILANGRNIFSIFPGQIFDFTQIVLLSLMVLAPLNFFSGMEFVFLTNSRKPPDNIYRGELLGFLSGGIITTFILLPGHQKTFLYFIYLLSVIVCFILTSKGKIKFLAPIFILTLFFSPVKIYHQIESKNLGRISSEIDTPYQNIKIVNRQSEIVIYQNNRPTTTLPAALTLNNETAVVFSRIYQPESNKWLVIGNYPELTAITDKIPELKIIWWEADKNFARIIRQYLDPTKFIFISEPLPTYLNSGQKFSLVLIYGRCPQTLAENYFFQKDFFKIVQNALTPDGWLVINIGGSETYYTPELKKLNASIFQTLKEVFPNVAAWPGENTLLIAGHQTLPGRPALLNNFSRLNLATKIITKNYLSYYLSLAEQKNFEPELQKTKVILNTDWQPAAVFYYLTYWRTSIQAKCPGRIIAFSILAIIALIIFFYFLRCPAKKTIRSIGTTAFSTFLFYWTLLALFQVRQGYIYQWIGFFSAAFMLGNFLGVNLKIPDFLAEHFHLITDIAATIFLIISTIIISKTSPDNYTFLLLTLGAGLIVGWQFLALNTQSISTEPAINIIYIADLVGSGLGGLVSGFLFFFPINLGLVLIFLILVKLLNNGLLIFSRSQRHIPE